ncbi:MAG: hypothetical protein JO235_21040 [Chroococcidiopsidaceae cyanobacterium CP_BM_RX_35]|nr:hypothetical protein [Chroococcidiopsidaceae cyanobacterium CP_BM_RX_35]
MNRSENRRLSAFSLATLLVSTYYGLGFLLGTAEKSVTLGVVGSLYAVSLGMGTIALLGLAKFYWIHVEQIWTLLGNRYGNSVKILVGLMSWSALIGIAAVQMTSGAFILKVLGAPVLPSMVVLAILFALISLLPVEKASWVCQGLLLLNFLALLYGLWVLHGLSNYWHLPREFISSIALVSPWELVGTTLSTILLVLMDMKSQQFVVQAKDLQSLYQGCLLAALSLLLLAFLPSSVVEAALETGILPPNLDGKETLPFILAWIGGGVDRPLGIVLVISLLVPALGIGSSLLRVQNKTILDFSILPAFNLNRPLIAAVNALLSLTVALNAGGSLIEMIVSFYAVYIAAVLVPFIAYLLAQVGGYTFSELSVRLSLIVGSIVAASTLVLTLIDSNFVVVGNAEVSILCLGIGFGILALFLAQVVERFFKHSRVEFGHKRIT